MVHYKASTHVLLLKKFALIQHKHFQKFIYYFLGPMYAGSPIPFSFYFNLIYDYVINFFKYNNNEQNKLDIKQKLYKFN